MNTLVTGAAGQLGREICRCFGRDGQVVALTRAELDITDRAALVAAVDAARPDVIVNCAAYNDVDGAETDPVTAMRVNSVAVRSLASAAQRTGATLVHYSTDFVFDGQTDRPYDESVEPAPQSVYASSKLIGEWFAAGAPRHYVLRVESLFGGRAETPGPDGRRLGSTLDRIVDALLDARPVKGFTDRTVSPSYVPDVAVATKRLVSQSAPDGLYHCVNEGYATWYDVARVAATRLGCESLVTPIRSDDVVMIASRPKYCALSNEKIVAAGARLSTWQDALDRYLTARTAAPERSA
ncbi:MAG: dTDP-4-dehydrorhamnose reductase [Acidobacteria bacterium]|nr:dTDP-4-dehydrorhamnose reductase [Acidobacteriota bacterium]